MISSNYYYVVTLVIALIANVPCEAQLSSTFYDSTCSNALSTIRTSIRQAVSRERRMAASLVRLHFHDCFVQGCDGSILLDDNTGERVALQNNNSVRGFEVVEAAKQAVEAICPGVVSCADVLTVAARDATVAVGGQSWTVKLGRRDSTTFASRTQAETDLPRGSDSLQTLISNFARKNLNERDMVALSGSHTIGQARCATFRARIYSNTSIDPGFASTRQRGCPQTGGNNNLAPLDLVTPNSFDNNYFRNLVQLKGLLASDQVLFSGGSSDSIVQGYINNPRSFQSDFGASMIKMGDIEPLTGGNGIIRKTCGSAN
ncbi:lignin-forming anionic peroxidase-like [Salvia hispanica]|uniref:lignin-forming anionic peroxidase-like n=1 Tax=Salvia hispanica TaxID=49212 RepID=UPI002008FD95|nr:lignin-forming anionic peroxidase-like [Salvia hispanica]